MMMPQWAVDRPEMLLPLGLAGGLLLGVIGLGLITWMRVRRDYASRLRLDAQRQAEEQALQELRRELAILTERLSQREGQLVDAEARARGHHEELARLREEHSQLRAQCGRLETQIQADRDQHADKVATLENARERLSEQFKLLASEILEEKSRRFTEQNQQNLGQLLDPLRQRLGEFQQKVERYYDSEGKERSALSAQVRELFSLNRSLSEDARNLTEALKGESKTRGNWGELVLERILESIGLQKGREYDVQVSATRDGDRLQPDVVIHLPDDRHIVVDSKVSLVDWERACSADDDATRQGHLKRHRDSLRQHIRSLSAKDYPSLYGLGSLDCVVMFVPIEPALLAAVADDPQLFQEAWQKQVLLVSSSTLFFALRTVAYLWRQDAQNRNAQEIARRGAELYDRLSHFVEEMDKVGDNLERAQRSFAAARHRLADGRGNVIRQAEMLRDLGVKSRRELPEDLREQAAESRAPSLLSAGTGAELASQTHRAGQSADDSGGDA
ncbi:MAG: DNA recombination protein RmuC [Oceanococcaceae bacterium]